MWKMSSFAEVAAKADSNGKGLFESFNSAWLIFVIIGSVGLLAFLLFILPSLSDKSANKEFDRHIATILSSSLSNKINVTEKEVITALSNPTKSTLSSTLKTVVKSLEIIASKSRIGKPVELKVDLKYNDGSSYSACTELAWEDLPANIRELLIRSESGTVLCPWSLA